MDLSSLDDVFGKPKPEPAPEPTPEPTGAMHGFTLEELEAEAHPDEWEQVCDNPQALECFARSLREARQIERGTRPERFTVLAYCAGCGVVSLPAGWFTVGRHETLKIPKAPGCPWCRNRLSGRPRPKPYPSRPLDHDPTISGRWPYSEHCRPLTWQGKDEREKE